MIDFFVGLTPLLKGIHIVALIIWCGGLVALPLMLSQHEPTDSEEDYRRIRQATHQTYVWCVTPAAVAAVVVGTWLIFLREVFIPWLYIKLLFVALLVAAHAWVGHIIVEVAEAKGRTKIPNPIFTLAAILLPIAAVLFLVLAKPNLSEVMLPEWLSEPRKGQLPFEIPRR